MLLSLLAITMIISPPQKTSAVELYSNCESYDLIISEPTAQSRDVYGRAHDCLVYITGVLDAQPITIWPCHYKVEFEDFVRTYVRDMKQNPALLQGVAAQSVLHTLHTEYPCYK